ncbi:MAG: hypothetical protein WCT08_02080 [Patescibacteria group bacterium]|jgi:hypothetical protein
MMRLISYAALATALYCVTGWLFYGKTVLIVPAILDAIVGLVGILNTQPLRMEIAMEGAAAKEAILVRVVE